MKKLITCTMAALFTTMAVSIAAPNEDAIIAKEKAAWQAFKDKNADEFKKLLSADIVAIYAEGPSDLQGELASMKKNNLKSFALSDFKATSPDSDTSSPPTKSRMKQPATATIPQAPNTPLRSGEKWEGIGK